MIKVEFFGNYRLCFGVAEISVEADNVGGMLKEIKCRFPQMKKEIDRSLLFLNDRALMGIFRNRVRLKDGDKVIIEQS